MAVQRSEAGPRYRSGDSSFDPFPFISLNNQEPEHMPSVSHDLVQPSPVQPVHEIMQEVLDGLSRIRKTLPAKLFYDAEGCRLFEAITTLPEYYLTRTERHLLRGIGADLASHLPDCPALIEFGASSEDKAVLLLETLLEAGKPVNTYVAIDVAAEALSGLTNRLSVSHPALTVQPVVADFTTLESLPASVANRPQLAFFPGSTIGNLSPAQAVAFMRDVHLLTGPDACFLVGADLRKDPAILLPAYNDRAGVTAAFNRNILNHINDVTGADLDPDGFAHRAVWNDHESRIEMHLVSRRPQKARIGSRIIHFHQGETIHTENSYKHTVKGFHTLAGQAGWHASATWTDSDHLFSIHLLRKDH
ncbi:Hypothetical protein GbCGDNIH2_0492 [Granulibacter bethesdensis]|uniref:Histidine-specific methyltransferase SAM-dependent domain-containing protein n=2 Tax=Granulibacter bethesdensis TaxID=364410 RepID=Q0BUW2_GRABC|nr:Hypothetical protein GbCGDNIH1_0492 [Granulibacter bethesdensis CGDNIH1]AHJ67512.1 Hypothetical protein GbCGDNIH2_0492 [Granulibacter bethesdensis]APH51182.1 Hypothetical protein GbCGDNIH5_0492 [Granulibacter bethesdensis]APH63876.1 Hypothetical protein GbCGDNIH1I4_0492 [Granulibacter bethesdensis]